MEGFFKHFLNEIVTLKRLSTVDDGAGGFTETWDDVLDGTTVKQIKCRIYRAKQNLPELMRVTAGLLEPEAYRMVCDKDADIIMGDRVVRDNGDKYNVLSIYAANTNRGLHHYEVSLSKPV